MTAAGFDFDSLMVRRQRLAEMGISEPSEQATPVRQGIRPGNTAAKAALFATTLLSLMMPSEGILPVSQDIGNFHLVRGRPVHGMLVDTGAARAIMGTDTLRHYIQDVLKPQGKVVSM